jgi:hypothetical protein
MLCKISSIKVEINNQSINPLLWASEALTKVVHGAAGGKERQSSYDVYGIFQTNNTWRSGIFHVMNLTDTVLVTKVSFHAGSLYHRLFSPLVFKIHNLQYTVIKRDDVHLN